MATNPEDLESWLATGGGNLPSASPTQPDLETWLANGGKNTPKPITPTPIQSAYDWTVDKLKSITPDKLKASADLVSGLNPVGGAIMSAATKAASNIGATGEIFRQLAAGNIHNLGDASRVSEQFLAAHPGYSPPKGSVPDALLQGASSNYNPLNWPGVLINKGGEGITAGLDKAGVPSSISTVVGPVASGLGNVALGTYGASKGILGDAVPPRLGERVPEPLSNARTVSAGSEPGEPLGAVTPEVKAKVAATVASHDPTAPGADGQPLGPINTEALTRHEEAASLPHPIQLTEGQATQNPRIISNELNGRGLPNTGPPMVDRLAQQNTTLVKNLNALRDQAAPDAGLKATPEHAQTLMDAYEAKDEAANADISAKYQRLTDANGGEFPVDGKTLVNNIDSTLKQKLKTGYVPTGLQSALQEFRDGRQMNFEDFETLRSDSAEAMRNGTGSEKAAAGIIRQEIEKLPLSADAAKLKPLADDARQAATDRFDAISEDPAYKAVVNGTAKSNTFADKYVLGAAREHLQAMQDNIGDQPQVGQAIGGITTNQLRARAGIDSQGNGNFSQGGYNKTLDSLRPNLDLLVDDKTAGQLGTLGNVARYSQFQPKGSFVNTSNSTVAAPSVLGQTAAAVAEHGANVIAHGYPVGTVVRKVVQGVRGVQQGIAGRRTAQEAQEASTRSLAPYAGSNLSPQALADIVNQRKP